MTIRQGKAVIDPNHSTLLLPLRLSTDPAIQLGIQTIPDASVSSDTPLETSDLRHGIQCWGQGGIKASVIVSR